MKIRTGTGVLLSKSNTNANDVKLIIKERKQELAIIGLSYAALLVSIPASRNRKTKKSTKCLKYFCAAIIRPRKTNRSTP